MSTLPLPAAAPAADAGAAAAASVLGALLLRHSTPACGALPLLLLLLPLACRLRSMTAAAGRGAAVLLPLVLLTSWRRCSIMV
jgi:hypothetical protein